MSGFAPLYPTYKLCHEDGSMTENEQDIPILKYVGLFALGYLILRLAASIFLSIVHAEYYRTLLIIGASASLPAYRFIEENGRILSKTERFKIIIGTFLCVLLINASYILRERMIFGVGMGPRFINEQVVDFIVLLLVFGPVMNAVYARSQGGHGSVKHQGAKMKYYGIRISAALFVMGSFGGGFIIGAQYGRWAGWTIFMIMIFVGIMLHTAAEKYR